MNKLSSTEFRKRFASLSEPCTVTVKGHLLGYWTPVEFVIKENERGSRLEDARMARVTAALSVEAEQQRVDQPRPALSVSAPRPAPKTQGRTGAPTTDRDGAHMPRTRTDLAVVRSVEPVGAPPFATFRPAPKPGKR